MFSLDIFLLDSDFSPALISTLSLVHLSLIPLSKDFSDLSLFLFKSPVGDCNLEEISDIRIWKALTLPQNSKTCPSLLLKIDSFALPFWPLTSIENLLPCVSAPRPAGIQYPYSLLAL